MSIIVVQHFIWEASSYGPHKSTQHLYWSSYLEYRPELSSINLSGSNLNLVSILGIELQYSTDMGKSWNAVVPPCYPGTSSCTQLYPGSIFFSDVYSSAANSRIVVPLPSNCSALLSHSAWALIVLFVTGYTWSPSTRFRWLQASKRPEAWFLDHVYIGNECPGACYGRGKCRKRTCLYVGFCDRLLSSYYA